MGFVGRYRRQALVQLDDRSKLHGASAGFQTQFDTIASYSLNVGVLYQFQSLKPANDIGVIRIAVDALN